MSMRRSRLAEMSPRADIWNSIDLAEMLREILMEAPCFSLLKAKALKLRKLDGRSLAGAARNLILQLPAANA